MKKIIASVLTALGLSAASTMASDKPNPPHADRSAVQGLRMQALSLKAEDIGLSRQTFPQEVWGILFETGYEKGAFTLVVLGDGTASLYFSTGGGIIGAGGHQSVRKASEQLLAAANHFVSAASLAKTYPIPASGQSTFYFLSYSGVLSYSARELDLGEGRDPLTGLFHAAHGVISRMREIEQARHEGGSNTDAPIGGPP